MGPDGCWQPGFQISCYDTDYGVLKAFMTIGHPTKRDTNAEVLNISLDQGQAQPGAPPNLFLLLQRYVWEDGARPMTLGLEGIEVHLLQHGQHVHGRRVPHAGIHRRHHKEQCFY